MIRASIRLDSTAQEGLPCISKACSIHQTLGILVAGAAKDVPGCVKAQSLQFTHTPMRLKLQVHAMEASLSSLQLHCVRPVLLERGLGAFPGCCLRWPPGCGAQVV